LLKSSTSILERLGIESSSIVLDIGFRDVNELVIISNLVGEHGVVYGIEPDQSVVARTVEQLNPMKNVRPMEGDAINIPLPDESVDAVIFKGVLHEVGDPLKALVESSRVCRKRGKIIVVDFSGFPRRWLVWSNLKWRLNHPGRIFGPSVDKYPGFSEDAIRTLLEGAGLVLERFEPHCADGRHAGHGIPLFLASARKLVPESFSARN
jgi:ubiquinone/menaquinone biosynthesis C-methylase UbiE